MPLYDESNQKYNNHFSLPSTFLLPTNSFLSVSSFFHDWAFPQIFGGPSMSALRSWLQNLKLIFKNLLESKNCIETCRQEHLKSSTFKTGFLVFLPKFILPPVFSNFLILNSTAVFSIDEARILKTNYESVFTLPTPLIQLINLSSISIMLHI